MSVLDDGSCLVEMYIQFWLRFLFNEARRRRKRRCHWFQGKQIVQGPPWGVGRLWGSGRQ